MNEADEVAERLRQTLVGLSPRDGRGAAVEAVVKHAGDDLSSLVLEVRYRGGDAAAGATHSERFGDLARIMESGSPNDPIKWLASFIITELDEVLLARD